MKRILTLFIAALICMSFCSCGGGQNNTNNDNKTSEPSATNAASTASNDPEPTNTPDGTPVPKADPKEIVEYLTFVHDNNLGLSEINAVGDCKIDIDGLFIGMPDSTFNIEIYQNATAENGNKKLDEVLKNTITDKASGNVSSIENDTYYTFLGSSYDFYAHKKTLSDGILEEEQKYVTNNSTTESNVLTTTLLALSTVVLNEKAYSEAVVENTENGGRKITVSLTGDTNKEAAMLIVNGEQMLFDIIYENVDINVDSVLVEMNFSSDKKMTSVHKVITGALKCEENANKTDATLKYEMTTEFAFDNIETITAPADAESYERIGANLIR